MSVLTRRRTPGPGQLVLVLPGIPLPSQAKPAHPPIRPRTAASRSPVTAGYVAPRPHGPVKARQMPGELHGAAQTSRQVQDILLRFQQTPDGRWRITQPRIPTFVAVASNSAQLVVAVRSAFTEAQVAAYSDWRNCAYDQDVPVYRRRRPSRSKPSKNRNDVHPPTAWKQTPDGRWMSPKGLLYPPDCQAVLQVRRKLFRQGLGLDPDVRDQLAERRRAS